MRTLQLFLISLLILSCATEENPVLDEDDYKICKGFFDIYEVISPDQEEALKNCTHLAGSIWIRYLPSHQDLSFLSNITRIDEDILIRENWSLQNLDGLDKLEYVGGRMEIESNHSLAKVAFGRLIIEGGLNIFDNSTLKSISAKSLDSQKLILGSNGELVSFDVDEWFNVSGLTVFNNVNLTRLPSLRDIEHLQEGLWINSSDLLEEIKGLENLKSAQKGISISSNARLKSGINLTSLRHVDGNLSIYKNPSLTADIDFPSLIEVRGSLSIFGNANISGLKDFSSLQTVEGSLIFQDNASLVKIGNFPHLNRVSGLEFNNNPLLNELPAFENISSLTNSLVLRDLPLLTNLDSFSSLRDIGGSLRVGQNEALIDLNGLNTLSRVGGNVVIQNTLKVGEGLNNLEHIGQNLFVEEPHTNSFDLLRNLERFGTAVLLGQESAVEELANHFSQSTQHFNIVKYGTQDQVGSERLCLGKEFIEYKEAKGCVYIEGSLTVSDNETITELSGLKNLLMIEGHLSIANNDFLTSLQGFDSLKKIGGSFVVENNSSLKIIDSFDNLETIGMSFNIKDNASLREINGFSNLVSLGKENYRFQVDSLTESSSVEENLFQNSIKLQNNPQFDILLGFNKLVQLPALTISNSISTVGGFDSLATANGLVVSGKRVTNLNLPQTLQGIDGNVSINGTGLLDLTSFNNITEIAGDLHLDSNQNLMTTEGFYELQSIGGEFKIVHLSVGSLNLDRGFNNLLYCGSPTITSLLPLESQDEFLARIEGKWYGDFCGRP